MCEAFFLRNYVEHVGRRSIAEKVLLLLLYPHVIKADKISVKTRNLQNSGADVEVMLGDEK